MQKQFEDRCSSQNDDGCSKTSASDALPAELLVEDYQWRDGVLIDANAERALHWRMRKRGIADPEEAIENYDPLARLPSRDKDEKSEENVDPESGSSSHKHQSTHDAESLDSEKSETADKHESNNEQDGKPGAQANHETKK